MCEGNSLDKKRKKKKKKKKEKREKKKKKEARTGCFREISHIKKKPAWDV